MERRLRDQPVPETRRRPPRLAARARARGEFSWKKALVLLIFLSAVLALLDATGVSRIRHVMAAERFRSRGETCTVLHDMLSFTSMMREVVIFLQALCYASSTQICVAVDKIYGGDTRLLELESRSPNFVFKETFTTEEEPRAFANHASQSAALSDHISAETDAFVLSDSGIIARAVSLIGASLIGFNRQGDVTAKIGSLQKFMGNNGNFAENILLSKGEDPRTLLIPIDHGLSLPECFEECTMDWFYPPPDCESFDCYKSLDAEEDITLMQKKSIMEEIVPKEQVKIAESHS